MVTKWDDGILDFTPICPRYMYHIQLDAMHSYLVILQKRAELEGIELGEFY